MTGRLTPARRTAVDGVWGREPAWGRHGIGWQLVRLEYDFGAISHICRDGLEFTLRKANALLWVAPLDLEPPAVRARVPGPRCSFRSTGADQADDAGRRTVHGRILPLPPRPTVRPICFLLARRSAVISFGDAAAILRPPCRRATGCDAAPARRPRAPRAPMGTTLARGHRTRRRLDGSGGMVRVRESLALLDKRRDPWSRLGEGSPAG